MLTSLRGKLAVIFMVITLTAVTVTTLYSRYAHLKFASSQASKQELDDLKLLSGEIETLLSGIIGSLLTLRDLPQLIKYLDAPDEFTKDDNKDDIQHFFLSLAKHQSIFSQIRFLNESGKEMVRVNTDHKNSYVVPDEDLQFKGQRYYFKETMELDRDEIYLSPMDLNVEEGVVERPYNPVMRYSAPIIDQKGSKRGVVVINIFGEKILDVVARHQQDNSLESETYYLINDKHFFLFHPDISKRFGFMFGNDERFDLYEPEIAEWLTKQYTIQNKRSSSVSVKSNMTGKNNIFSFFRIPLRTRLNKNQTIQPLGNTQTLSPTAEAQARTATTGWFLVSVVDEAVLLAGLTRYSPTFILFTFCLFALCILVAIITSWFMARPVVSLATAAIKIQKGDLSARAQVYTKDEMGDFGNLFNAMAQQLEVSHEGLQRSEKKYRHIFENSKDCIFVADTSCQLLDLNAAGQELFGYSAKDQPLKKLPIECCTADGPTVDLQKILTDSGYVQNYETIVQRPDGSERICMMTASIVHDKIDNFIGYEGILRDITERRLRRQQSREFQMKLQEEIVLAEERERRSLGQALHEELAQNLASIQMKIQETEAEIKAKNIQAELLDGLGKTRKLAGIMIKQIRTMIFDLYPVILEKQGLVASLYWYADSFSKRSRIEVIINELANEDGLGESQKIYLFRAFKELLHNCWKHANASEVVVTLSQRDNNFRMVVDDTGKGFNTDEFFSLSSQVKGIGLLSIREWVKGMDGTFVVESHQGGGTRVVINIPTQGERDD